MQKVLFIFLFAFCFQAKSQTWAPIGAQWHYRMNYPIYPYLDGVLELNVTNTVIVNSIVCQQIIGTYYGKTMSASSPSTTINNYVDEKIYANNGVYYRYDADLNKFDTIANFNAAIGDKWLLSMLPTSTFTNNGCPFAKPVVTVLNSGTVSINSQTLKQIVVTYSAWGTPTITIVEKIGSTSGFLFPSYHCINDGPLYGEFNCYSDPGFALYKKAGVTICNYDPTNITEHELPEFKFYPDPVGAVLNIAAKNGDQIEVKIVDLAGREVLVSTTKNQMAYLVNVEKLTKGIYFVRLYSAGQFLGIKKIIKE